MERETEDLEDGMLPQRTALSGVQTTDMMLNLCGRRESPPTHSFVAQPNLCFECLIRHFDHVFIAFDLERPMQNLALPSLHSIFEWIKETATRNLNLDPDSPSGGDTLVVNMSSVHTAPSQKLYIRSQYNKTALWSPNDVSS